MNAWNPFFLPDGGFRENARYVSAAFDEVLRMCMVCGLLFVVAFFKADGQFIINSSKLIVKKQQTFPVEDFERD